MFFIIKGILGVIPGLDSLLRTTRKKYDSDLFSPVTSVLIASIFPNNSTLTFESKNDKEKVCTVNCPTQATYFAHFDFCICIS